MQNHKIIFFKPFLKETIWAGKNLKEVFKTKNNIGEAWLLSAIENNESICISDNFKNKNLREIFQKNPHLFNFKKTYPNLSKIIDTDFPLSVQVHPDNEYAQKFNSLGKEECWYVLRVNYDHPFILGYNAKNSQEAKELILNKKWDQLLKKQEVNQGDFLYVPVGQIHAIPAHATVFEMQQSSDITYRLYDYDRLDLNGEKRLLHIKESLDVLNEPENYFIKKQPNNNLVKNHLFNLNIINHEGEKKYNFLNENWIEFFVLEGEGSIDDQSLKKYDSLIITSKNNEFILKGNLKIIINIV
ncbi:class I mannose-6-phosphate isomerase [Mycoplasma iguanae]|uniref:Class I mannose-6-phosphate isomerase n=1 Tax=Mycoplasma iguanae TaxID=292461 RepID=A0ABY5R7K2_9MOLU|nr:type I phosphomannose isomerase catalytic subunit [Mycoplasma iguanae]UVD81434.1 class I mannose-6-phosphate isomerase [Mycoplasma iguanae]